ncbi:uncharacterized protein LOC129718233 [Wyeomyia smithii]|uniref:uncharacterized protein LOC129718233 n=1 Tax=Wyeomyia smithii TaxID=174621 RepID=UPI002467CF6C|nr:uncharacterized protein LOC129718233 [Wyeomyia smithii]XP_055524779.1 uncharacterized protein LOC129718233 [Wyeomyia smithii]
MCCCCLRISLNLLTNLLCRLSDDIMDLVHYPRRQRWPQSLGTIASSCTSSASRSTVFAEDQYQCQAGRRGHHLQQQQPPPQPCDGDGTTDAGTGKGTDLRRAGLYNVIYDTVEIEPYFYRVDRSQSEKLLERSSLGACLVRPSKFGHAEIRYILTIHAARSYFHLYIRRTGFNGMYALGLPKPKERRFKFPADIVQYYCTHLLECANGTVTVKLYLRPLVKTTPESAPEFSQGA